MVAAWVGGHEPLRTPLKKLCSPRLTRSKMCEQDDQMLKLRKQQNDFEKQQKKKQPFAIEKNWFIIHQWGQSALSETRYISTQMKK